MSGDLLPLRVDGRLDQIRSAIATAGADALVVTNLTNVRWCTGFTGSAGVLLVTSTDAALITDSRYATQAPAQIADGGAAVEVRISADTVAEGRAFLDTAHGPGIAVALEADHVTWADHQRWEGALDAELVATHGLITELRSVKTEAELARMARAAAITDDALVDAIPLLVAGTTEREVALALEDGMRARGATGPAYETIVAGGPNAALPHARPSDRPFAPGDLVVIDAGSLVDGYRSDMTRTFVIGDADETARTIHDLVTRAQAAGVEAVRAGVVVGDIDRACRDLITAEGYGPEFAHGTGHGVGLDIHELPSVRGTNTDSLQPGQVITVEPGIYLPGVGGVRVEDMVVVTDDGCRPLTRSPKISLS
ncbi:MAG: Xaa-Pro peptidase family protein [Acidimicrobiales bacterium]